jgi:hypothetical protein
MDQDLTSNVWRKCTTCKKPIYLGAKYWVCSVSTCNRIRTGLVFCDLKCFDAHVPVLNHRDAGAFEKVAPKTREEPKEESPTPPRKTQGGPSVSGTASGQDIDTEILVVVSKVKSYIRDQSDMNTSDSVSSILTKHVIRIADKAMENAQRSMRKTVLDRDVY